MKYRVPINVQAQIQEKIDAICEKEFPDCPFKHIADIRGKFIYIKRLFADGRINSVCRLTYDDDLENMEFAIFKYSNERYSSDEFFPGMECVDGTVEGAVRAGMHAYPVSKERESMFENMKYLIPILESFFK